MNFWYAIAGVAAALIFAIGWQTRHYCQCSEPKPVPTGSDSVGPVFRCQRCGKRC